MHRKWCHIIRGSIIGSAWKILEKLDNFIFPLFRIFPFFPYLCFRFPVFPLFSRFWFFRFFRNPPQHITPRSFLVLVWSRSTYLCCHSLATTCARATANHKLKLIIVTKSSSCLFFEINLIINHYWVRNYRMQNSAGMWFSRAPPSNRSICTYYIHRLIDSKDRVNAYPNIHTILKTIWLEINYDRYFGQPLGASMSQISRPTKDAALMSEAKVRKQLMRSDAPSGFPLGIILILLSLDVFIVGVLHELINIILWIWRQIITLHAHPYV